MNSQINFALLGVFPDIKCQPIIQKYLDNRNQSNVYWLPWGNRQKSLSRALQYLVDRGIWQLESKKTCLLYSTDNDINTLKFFHHDSKKQGGNGKIRYRYDIKFIALNKLPFCPKREVDHSLLEESSETWFGISGYRSARRLGDSLDFASDFKIIESFKTWRSCQMHETEHAHLLYFDLAIVTHFTHGKKNPCDCPQCIPL